MYAGPARGALYHSWPIGRFRYCCRASIGANNASGRGSYAKALPLFRRSWNDKKVVQIKAYELRV